MKISHAVIFCLLLHRAAFAGVSVYTGGNVSAVQPGFNHRVSGEVFGIQKNWGEQNGAVSFGIIYATRGGILKDKNFAFAMTDQGYHLDIHVSIDYLELPLFIKIYKAITKNIDVGVCFGPSLAIAIRDNTESKNATHFDMENSDSADLIKIDYWENFEPLPVWSECSMICMNAGLIFKLSKLFLEIRYNYAMGDVHTAGGMKLDERLHSFNFLLGIEIL
jgi:hypothetical protein